MGGRRGLFWMPARRSGEEVDRPLTPLHRGAMIAPDGGWGRMEAGSTEPSPQEAFAEIECGNFAAISLRGSVSGKWTEAANKPTKTGGIQFTAGSGEQDLIESTPYEDDEAATLEATQVFKFKANYEIERDSGAASRVPSRAGRYSAI